MSRKPKLALIDSNALIHRAYHALPPMSTNDGTPTQAVYGFTAMLLKMFATLKPTHVVAAFDVKGPTFRHEEFEDYKAHRKATPDDLIEQFAGAREVLAAFGIPILDKKGFEADDVIGTLVTMVDGDVKKVIVTGDMDTLQLIDEHTSVFTLKRGVTDTILFDEQMVREKFGFGPEHVIDYKGLRGDPSDNIPGVDGIGDKTAKDLVSQFGTIENIYTHLEEVPKRAKTRLEGQKKEALKSKRLATIRRDVPITFSLEDAELEGYDTEEVRRVFGTFEFHSLMQRLPDGGTGIQPSLLRDVPVAAVTELPKHYYLIESKKEEEELKKILSKAEIVAFDTENDMLGARTYPIVGMSFAVQDEGDVKAYYVPVTAESVKEWKDILEDSGIKKTGHNLKYDYEVLLQSGIHLKGIIFDSMVAAYLLNPGRRQYGLDALAGEELNYHTIPLTTLIGEGKDQKRVSQVPVLDLARYAAEDAEVALKLYNKLMPQIKDQGLLRVLSDIEMPLIPVLGEVENNGVAVDLNAFKKLNTKVSRKISVLEKKIIDAAGKEFNINSTQQLRVILFEKLNLPTTAIKRTQTGFSTASSELEKLRGLHPIIEYIEEYRELAKLRNTYIETLPELVDPKTKRIYASFNQTVAATGRLSSSDPNLQNIPVRTELGQEIRRAFIASEDMKLVKADYSQIELRLAAHMSQDPKMIDVFRAGEDIHTATAAWVYGVSQDTVTSSQRREAKTLNFGVLYGMGPQNFARASGISLEEARSFIGRYRDQYKQLIEYLESSAQFAREHGYVETLLGRRRPIPEIHSHAPVIRAQAERIASNFPLQGTAADILKKAMIELQKIIEQDFSQAKMLLTVHDELVCEVPGEKADNFASVMKKTMESVITLDIPLVVDVGIGVNWQDIEEV